MKLRILGLAILLTSTSFLMIGCPSNNSPSSPSAPAPTNTVCTDGSGHTCTPTSTGTPTSTATNTSTGTPSSTATATNTKTLTGTPTFTKTSTFTATVTDTATMTPTATITNTPTITSTPSDTGTPTQTGTPTNTVQFTATSTPSNTPTSTSTNCPGNPTPTNTVVTSNGIAMHVTYSGAGTVSASNPIYVFITDSFGGGSSFQAVQFIDTNGGGITIYGMNTGTYYMAMFYNAAGDGHFYQPGGVNPHVGDQAQFLGVPSGCNPAGATPLNLTGGVTDIGSVSFTGGTLWGFGGSLTYGGSAGGTVSTCNPICVAYYTDSGYTNEQSNRANFTNGSRYDMDTFNIGGGCSSASAYVQAWYAKSGNTSGPQAGDPVVKLGSVANAAVTNLTITIP